MSNDDQTLKSSELSMLLFGSNAALPTTEESQKSNPLLLQKKKYQKESIELSDMDAAQASQLLKEKHAVGKLAADGKDKGVIRHRRKVHRSYHQIDSLEKQSAILRQQVFQISAEGNMDQDDLEVKANEKEKLQRHQEDEEDEEFQIRSNRVSKQAKTEDMVLHRKSDEHGPSFNAKKDDLSDASSEASTRKRRRHRRTQSSSSCSSDSSVPRRRRRRTRMAEDSSDSDSDSSDDSIDKRRSKAREKARAKSRQLNSKETLRKQSSSPSSNDRDNSSDLPRRSNSQLPFIQNSDTDLQPIIKKEIIHDTQPLEKKQQIHSPSSSSSSSLSSSSDEDDVKPTISLSKPLFVPKHKRNNIKEKEQQEKMDQSLQRKKEEQVQNRIRTSRALVAQVVAAEVQERELVHGGDQNEFAETGGTTMPPPDDNDNLNDKDVEMERKAWEVRELLRLLREFEVIIHDYKESKELERRRNMTDDERYKEDVAAGRYKKPGEKDGNAAYMQRYHHRGAFYMDDDTLKDKDDVRQKAAEYSRAATGEDKYDRRLMPKVMQVKRPGFANQTRYKGLKHEDTSDKTIQYLPTKVDHHRMSNMSSDQRK